LRISLTSGQTAAVVVVDAVDAVDAVEVVAVEASCAPTVTKQARTTETRVERRRDIMVILVLAMKKRWRSMLKIDLINHTQNVVEQQFCSADAREETNCSTRCNCAVEGERGWVYFKLRPSPRTIYQWKGRSLRDCHYYARRRAFHYFSEIR
jgi:hypothetical protein